MTADSEIDSLCQQVHQMMERLPEYTTPRQVPFTDGLYFFYEIGEKSEHSKADRIVRIGNHPRAKGGLVRRLQQHYSGRKNGSVFRRLLGGAILRARQDDHHCLLPAPGRGHWELQNAKPCAICQPVEEEVSKLLRQNCSFRCVAIEDRDERNALEADLISLISACSICKPSSSWLGLQSYPEAVHLSGLWNSQFTEKRIIEADLPHHLERNIRTSQKLASEST